MAVLGETNTLWIALKYHDLLCCVLYAFKHLTAHLQAYFILFHFIFLDVYSSNLKLLIILIIDFDLIYIIWMYKYNLFITNLFN